MEAFDLLKALRISTDLSPVKRVRGELLAKDGQASTGLGSISVVMTS